jgi:hypothetical protein
MNHQQHAEQQSTTNNQCELSSGFGGVPGSTCNESSTISSAAGDAATCTACGDNAALSAMMNQARMVEGKAQEKATLLHTYHNSVVMDTQVNDDTHTAQCTQQ